MTCTENFNVHIGNITGTCVPVQHTSLCVFFLHVILRLIHLFSNNFKYQFPLKIKQLFLLL